jgi:hypothetical protein
MHLQTTLDPCWQYRCPLKRFCTETAPALFGEQVRQTFHIRAIGTIDRIYRLRGKTGAPEFRRHPFGREVKPFSAILCSRGFLSGACPIQNPQSPGQSEPPALCRPERRSAMKSCRQKRSERVAGQFPRSSIKERRYGARSCGMPLFHRCTASKLLPAEQIFRCFLYPKYWQSFLSS